MAVGHRIDPRWGEPVSVTGRVLHLSDRRLPYRGGIWDGVVGEMGPAAVLEVPSRGGAGAVRILLSTHATYDWADEQFRSVDLDPAAAKFIVAKNPMIGAARGGFDLTRGSRRDTRPRHETGPRRATSGQARSGTAAVCRCGRSESRYDR